jgi:hypothetical protein
MRPHSLARPGLGLLTALLSLGQPLAAQRLGGVSGTVVSTTNRGGIAGARVVLVGTSFVASTNTRGEFTLDSLPPGKYIIQASAIGFATLQSTIEVKPLETLEVEFDTDPESVRLPDLEVSETPNLPPDFLRRSQEGGGRYFHRAEIERRDPRTVGDLLRGIAGMRVDCRGAMCRANFVRAPRSCQPAYYLDGIPVDGTVVWLQSPRDLEGVEVYSGEAEVPPELNRYSGCGVIVLWTRSPPARPKKEKKPKP